MHMTFTIINHPSLVSILKLDIMTNRDKCSLLHTFILAKHEVQWCVTNNMWKVSMHCAHMITPDKHLFANTCILIIVRRKHTCFQNEQPLGPSNANGWWWCHFRDFGWWMKKKWDNLHNKFIIWRMNCV
jgi:hypothetical protein